MHAMDYIDAATTGILLTTHPSSRRFERNSGAHQSGITINYAVYQYHWDDTLHFYRYLHTHILVAEEQFLLLIDVPIQNQAQQLEIHQVFTCSYLKATYWHDMT